MQMVAEIERAAAMRKPAQDDAVRRDDLLPVDAEVLPRLSGPRVTVRPQVSSGPTSAGQHVCTGRRARSTSFPSQTTSWQGADDNAFGAMSITLESI
jgi:hypothetical protein